MCCVEWRWCRDDSLSFFVLWWYSLVIYRPTITLFSWNRDTIRTLSEELLKLLPMLVATLNSKKKSAFSSIKMNSLVPVSIFKLLSPWLFWDISFASAIDSVFIFTRYICQHTILYLVTGYLCHAWCNCYRYIWNGMGIFLHLIVLYKLRTSGVVWFNVSSGHFRSLCCQLYSTLTWIELYALHCMPLQRAKT